eukprot:gene12751-3479_t
MEAYRPTKNQSKPNVAVGDVVLLKDESKKRSFWKICRIEELIVGKDEVVRSAIIRLGSDDGKIGKKTLCRPLKLLIPLEVKPNHLTNSLQNPPTQLPLQPAAQSPSQQRTQLPMQANTRPRRRAAVLGETIKLKFTRGDSYQIEVAVDDVSFSDECYNIQICNTGQVMYKVENRSASIFYEYNTKLGSHLRCQWLITADPRLRIHLSAEYFHTAYNDKVLIHHDHSSTISGTRAPFHLVSPSNILRIEFNATHMNNSQGFAFNISSTDAQMHSAKPYDLPSECRNQDQRYFGTIKPRLQLSSGTYFNDEDCVYKFHATNGYRMRFDFRFFKTEIGPDYVEVLHSGIIGKGLFSGDLDPFYFVSKGSWLSFRFRTNNAHVERGFILQVSLTASPAIGVTKDQKTLTTALPRTIPVSECQRPVRMLWSGDKFFGSLRPLGAFLRYWSINCMWTVPKKADFKYVIEITHAYLDDVISLLKITDETHSSTRTLSTFTQARNWENLIVVSDGKFTVKSMLKAYSLNVSVISYSIYPVPDAFNTTTPAKKVSSGNLSAELIGSSFGIMAFLVLTFIFIRYRIKKRQRAERSNRGANQYLPVQTPDVCYAPDSALGDASPSYSDATKEGVVFMDSRNAVVETPSGAEAHRNQTPLLTSLSQLSSPRVVLPAVDDGDSRPGSAALIRSRPASAASVDSVSDSLHPLTNLPPFHPVSPLSVETPSGAEAHRNQTPLLTSLSQLSSPRVVLPAVDDGDSRPGSAALIRSRPASAASVDSVSDSLHPLLTLSFYLHIGGYTPKWSCDFEGGSCDWLQSQDDGLDWTNDIGSKWNMVDHTIGSLYGHFMLLRLSSLHSETGTGKLVSPLMRPTKKPCQMVFHYQGKGSSGYPLQLVIRILSKEFTKIFHKDLFNTTVMPNYWEKVELSIQSSAYYQLEIVGYIARSRSAYIAIDDVMFTSECLTDEETGVKILKPPFSSAFNFPEGVFYYLGSVSGIHQMPQDAISTQDASMQYFGDANKRLAMTDFHLSENLETNGLEEDELEIEIKVKDELDRLNAAIKGINQLGKEASNAETLFQNTMKESFTALEDCAREIGVERIERARPYFNEVKLVQRASKRVHLERELCKRIEENEREAKERAKEAEDCCMKMMGNSYVDVDALEALNQAVLDVMNNAFIKASRCHELDKYDKKYTERRKNLAKLQARLRNEIDNARPYYELKNQLNKMLLCKKKRVESIKDGLKSARNVYKASMKKIEEMSEDIHKERGTCPDLTHKTCTSAFGTPKCYSHNQQCDYVNNCPGGEDEDDCHLFNRCNFKKDFCSWVPSKNITLKWKRYRDLGSGGYIIRLNSSVTQDKTEVSRLQLHGFIKGSTNLICVIRFSYRMLPWHNVVLRLVLKWPDESRTVWSRTQARNDMWRKEFLELRYSGIFELWFEAGGKPDVSIYIDLANVSFSKQCVFINESKAYDKERCTFENSLCNWKVDQNVPITLTRRTSNAMHGFFGPQMDHTTNSTSGYYIHFDARKRLPEVFGQLISNVMQISSSRKCTFRWFYRIYQDGYFFTDKLLVIYYNPILKTEKKLWYVEGEQGANWKLGSVTFDITSFNYQIILRFERGDSFLSDIAVDDVSFSEECYKRNDCSIAKTFFTINGSTAAILFTFQQNMGNDVNCRWSIDTDSRLKIGLSADYFVTDPNDFLAMQSGNVDTNNTVGNFSGYIAPFYFISNSSRMEIHFHATQLNRSHGFALNLFSTDEKVCNGPVFTKSRYQGRKTFKTPSSSYGSNLYSKNENCTYQFYVSQGYRLKFNFTKFDTENGSDYIEILNSAILGPQTFSGALQEFYFISKNSFLSFNFITNDVIEKEGCTFDVTATMESTISSTLKLDFSSERVCNVVFLDILARGATRYLKTVEPQVSTMSPTACDNYNSNLWPGDKYFGSTISLGHFSSYPRAINCSWTMPQKTGLKYVIEISYFYAARHLDALSISTISKSSPQLLSSLKKIKKLENLLVITDDPFLVKTIIASSHRRFAHAFTYSVYPGCYDASLKYVFFKDKNTESKEQCVSSCYKRDFQYAFFIVDIKNECYCDNMEPARRSRYMKHPRHCCIPPFTGSCNRGDSGVLLLSVDATATTTENKQSQDSGRIATIAASVSVFLVVAVIVGVVIFLRWRRKKSADAASSHASLRKTSTHNSVEMEPIAFACELPAVRNSDNTLIKHGDRKNSADLSARS